jgi:hypothetical protein
MWAIVNTTPYATDRSWVQDKDANKIWLVVVKATFDLLADGSIQLAKVQQPVLRMGEHEGADGQSGLRHEADLMGVKPGTDVVVNGSAYARPGRRALSVDAQITVGPVKKRVRIFGDRRWDRSLVGLPIISDPQPFESMPIRYERAYGGWDRHAADPAEHRLESRNPIGTGFCTRAQHCFGCALPNVEDPRQLISSWDHRPAPAGLGCVACDWSPRRELAGTYDKQWLVRRAPLWAVDFDARYHQCSPVDQQVPGYLHGGEMVELLNLAPQGLMVFALPRVYPFFETRFGRDYVEHRAQLCTVTIEPDLLRLTMAWQTSLVCNKRVDDLDATIVTEKRKL